MIRFVNSGLFIFVTAVLLMQQARCQSGEEPHSVSIDDIDRRVVALPGSFTYRFTAETIDPDIFQVSDSQNVTAAAGGLTVSGASTDVMTTFEVHGDFDIRLSYDNLEFGGATTTRAMLSAGLADDRQNHCRLFRSKDHRQKQVLTASIFREALSATSNRSSENQDSSGTLRITRINDRVVWSYATGNSKTFVIARTEIVSDSHVYSTGLRFGTFATGNSRASVRWRQMTLRAEKILQHKGDATPILFVMNADGSQRQQVLTPPDDYTAIGSPDWSPDGSRVAFSVSYGDDASSRVLIARINGANVTDCGPGLLPSFSPNGELVVFSEKGEGVIVMQPDGSGRRRVSAKGWAATWGRSNEELLWIDRSKVYRAELIDPKPDLLMGSVRTLQTGISVSPNGRCIALIHRDRAGNPVTSVRGFGQDDELKTVYEGSVAQDVSWAPDSSAILLTRSLRQKTQLIRASISPGHEVTEIGAFPSHWRITSADWSPDGKMIAIVALVSAAPVELTGR